MLAPVTSLSTQLEPVLNELICRNLGADARIKSVVPVSRRAAVTARLQLQGGKGPQSVFVKHVFEEEFPSLNLAAEHVEFAEEMLVHRFLQRLMPVSPFKANLIDADDRGVFLLDDLGESGHGQMRSFEHLISRLARSLVLLHDCTRANQGLYNTMRQEAGLGTKDNDKRRYGGPAQYKRFAEGSESLLRSALLKGLDVKVLEDELNSTLAFVQSPGKLNALIHDDLGNARQTFEKDDSLYLLDFEYARYGLSLIDLCKPMMGKFEVNLDNGTYLWNNPGFPMALADSYREQMGQISGLTFDDEEWQKALTAAFVFHIMTLLGRLEHLEPDRRLIGTVQQNINGILYRLYQILPAGNEGLKTLLEALLGLKT